jgi:tetratricopeptide (TPR) repeat protein
VTRALLLAVVLTSTAIAGAVAYQASARDRAYRALVARGDAALAGNQTFAAIEAYSGAIALRPDSMLAHLRRGETYQKRDDLDTATRDFRRAAALDPTAVRPLEALGDVLSRRGRFQRAAEAYEQRLRLDDQSARVAYKLGVVRYRSGALDAAAAAAREAIRLADAMPDAHYLLGLCLRDQGRLAASVAEFERAVQLAPGMVAAREELADAFRSLGRASDELEQLQLLAALDRTTAARQVALALAQARAGQAELAVATIGRALERAPDQPLIYGALGQIWLDQAVAGGDPVFLQKAREALERAAAVENAPSDVLTRYGRALLLGGEVEQARRVLRLATTRYPIEAASFLAYAEAAERLEQFNEARAALLAHAALVPDGRSQRLRSAAIARLSLQLDDTATALTWARRAAADGPEDPQMIALLADALLRAGDRHAATLTIEAALDLDPSNPVLLDAARRAGL